MINWHTEKRPVASLKDYEKNPRKFTDKGMAQLKESIDKLGYIDPIAINTDNTIIGGHARKKTLQQLGLKEVDVRVPDRLLTDREVKEAIIRLNKNIAGEFDFDVLTANFEIDDLVEWGFEKAEFNAFAQGKTDPDDVPEVPVIPITQQGDIWVLGEHRIMCGDSTNALNVESLLWGGQPHLMVTDPPYGVDYDPKWRAKAGVNKNKAKMGEVANDDKKDWREAWALFPGNIAYVWHADRHASSVQESLEACDFTIRSQIIWAKDRFALSRGDYHWQHEPCWYAVKGTGKWCGDRKQSTLWQINSREDSGHGHSTQKPIECMKRPIENNSEIGDSVYEPFSGSGTTIIAAEMTNRKCYAMEVSPAYVDMAIIRWQNFTGKTAQHIDGTLFNERQKAA